MKNRIFACVFLFVMLMGLLTFAFEVESVAAFETIYIRVDGSVEPLTAPIQRDGDVYVLIDDIYGRIIVERDSVVVDGAGRTVQGSGSISTPPAISIGRVDNVTIKNMKIERSDGVSIFWSSNDRILGNSITANYPRGIWLQGSSSCYVSGNNITHNGIGIQVEGSNNVFEKNNVTDNGSGIRLSYGSNNVLRSNRIARNGINFGVLNSLNVSNFINDVDSSNTVDGKPIYWWINKQDMVVPPDAGFVALVNCTRISVKNLNLTSNLDSINLISTTNSTVTQNSITDDFFFGILLLQSSYNSISENELTDQVPGAAIYMDSSDHNEISRNSIISNIDGLILFDSSYNAISGNKVVGNGVGISLWEQSSYNSIVENEIALNGEGMDIIGFGSENSILHNNFVNNRVFSNTLDPQVWDDGYPSGGNYWSDYSGTDLYTGPYQNMTGSDGIGDTPRQIEMESIDRYPLIHPWKPPIQGDVNKDNKVDIKDLALVATAFGLFSADSKWNVICDLNQDGKVDIRDLVLVAKNFGKTSS